MILSTVHFPGKFNIKKESEKNIYNTYHFHYLNIRSILYYSRYLGIKKDEQRLFSLLLVKCLPTYEISKGVIGFNSLRNRLTLYIPNYSPIEFAEIENDNP